MGRIEKIKRQIIAEANKRILNEEIQVMEPEMMNSNMSSKPSFNDRGIELECVKIDYENPKESESAISGPYPWHLVYYNKKSRPVKLYLGREEKPRDVVWGGEYNEEIVIGFEEITDPELIKELGVSKKYIMTTNNSPGLTGKQYCRVDGTLDKEWDTNFFSYNGNQNVIDPYPQFPFL